MTLFGMLSHNTHHSLWDFILAKDLFSVSRVKVNLGRTTPPFSGSKRDRALFLDNNSGALELLLFSFYDESFETPLNFFTFSLHSSL